MGGRVPFRGGHGGAGRGNKGRGDKGRGDKGRGSDSRGSNPHLVSGTTPLVYRLHDSPETSESPEGSVGTPISLVQRSGSSSSVANASLSTTLVADAIAAENNVVRAAAATAEAAAAAEAVAAIAAAAIAAAAAHAGEDENMNGAEGNKIILTVVTGKRLRFEPSPAIRSGKILRSRVCKEGSKWANVTQEMKTFYWEEFKKYFKWHSALYVLAKDCWNTSMGKQYGDFINDRKKDKEKQDYIPAGVWSRWNAYWNTPEALELSQLKRAARNGGVNGQCSKHTGGSITASEHAKRFEKKNKRKPMYNELFDLMHRKKGGADFVDDKSASIDALFKARKLQLLQLSDGSPMPSDDEIYLEVVGGQNKDGDVYGIGSESSSIVNPSCLSGSDQPQVSLSVVQEIVQQFLTDFEKLNEERIGQRIGKEVESRITPLQTSLLRVQDLVACLPSLSDASHPAQGLEENPTNNGEPNRDGNFMRDNIEDPSRE